MGKHTKKPASNTRRPAIIGILIALTMLLGIGTAIGSAVATAASTPATGSSMQQSPGHISATGATAQSATSGHSDTIGRTKARGCYRTVVGNHVNVRTAPRFAARVVGQVHSQARLWSPCKNEVGDYYRACGKTRNYWGLVIYRGHQRYIAGACLRP